MNGGVKSGSRKVRDDSKTGVAGGRERLLVAGRVGELADIASPISFSLLERIFGHKGPYRNVLASFKVPVRDVSKSYLANVSGRIYGDLKVENEVFWKDYAYELSIKNELVVPTLNIFKDNLLVRIKNFISKTLFESRALSNLLLLQHEIGIKYKGYSEIVKFYYAKKFLSVGGFLDAYKLVIYVSYLYDLLYQLYGSDLEDIKRSNYKYIDDYIKRNDFLVLGGVSGSNFELLDMRNISEDGCNLDVFNSIPYELEDLDFEDKKIAALLLAQCARDNMRLKTNVLLHLLSLSLFDKVKKLGLEDSFAFMTVDEIEDLTSNSLDHSSSSNSSGDSKSIEELVILANKRKSIFNPELAKKLPKVIATAVVPSGLGEIGLIPINDINNHAIPIDSRSFSTAKEGPLQNIFNGTPCSKGVISGLVQYIDNPKDDVSLPIVFFPNASPVFTHHFRQAKGLIFKVGSALSHGAIVAREMGVPAAVIDVGYEDIKGREVELDGSKGTLKVL